MKMKKESKRKRREVSTLPIPDSAISLKGENLDEQIASAVESIIEYYSNLKDTDVTDEKFFELLEEDAEWLKYDFAIGKIKHWQAQMISDATNKHKYKDMLWRIGTVLGKERKKLAKGPVMITAKRYYVFKKLEDRGINRMRSEGNCILTLNELFGKAIISRVKEKGSLMVTNAKLADRITAVLCGCSEHTVKSYRKKVKKKYDGYTIPDFEGIFVEK